jgi:hypothetical protein
MKTRNGFVSNSSSSSFIIKTKEYSSVFDLAMSMVKAREWDSDEDIIAKLKNNPLNLDRNHPISFRSCNYNTYIARIGDYYYIQTCNNHDWGNQLDRDIYTYNPEVSKEDIKNLVQMGVFYSEEAFYDCWYESMYLTNSDLEFYFVEYNVIGHYEIESKNKHGYVRHLQCPKHSWEDLIHTNDGKKICIECEYGNKNA